MAATRAQVGTSSETPWLDKDTLGAVRPEVRRVLERSQAFRALSPEKQREIAGAMVHVAAYMANPQGLAKDELTPGKGILSKAQADIVGQAGDKASEKIGTFAGADVQAGALRQGTEAYKELIGSVNFPEFVGGLIQNVFQAIVDASIQQMNAYAELLKAVSQTVDQFAQDNISMNNARDWMVDKYPGQLSVQMGDGGEEGGPRLVFTNEDDDGVLAQINQDLQLAQAISDISDAEQEAKLVQAARLQMARSRQQMLASMVILGINRIVITDGAINAKVVFQLQANDQAQRRARASMYDSKSSSNKNTTVAGGSWGWGGAASANVNEQKHLTTVSSSVDETSESKAELKSKLTGEVRVNFKSDYFPMKDLASPGMIAAIQGNATPFDPNYVPGQRTAPAAAPVARPAD